MIELIVVLVIFTVGFMMVKVIPELSKKRRLAKESGKVVPGVIFEKTDKTNAKLSYKVEVLEVDPGKDWVKYLVYPEKKVFVSRLYDFLIYYTY